MVFGSEIFNAVLVSSLLVLYGIAESKMYVTIIQELYKLHFQPQKYASEKNS